MQVKVTSIGENAFSGNSNLQIIRIPDTVKQLDANCFKNASSLKKIYLNGKTFNWTSPEQFSWYGSNITVYCHLGSHGERFAKVNGAKVANINSSSNTISGVTNNSNNSVGIVKGANNSKKTTNNNTKNSNTTVQKNNKTSPGSTQKANTGKNSVEKSNNTKKSTTNKNTTTAPKDTTPPTIYSSITSDKTKAILRWSATDNVGITGYKIVKQANAGSASGYINIKSTKSLSNIDYTFYENGIWYLYAKDAQGNSSYIKITVGDIDRTSPTIEDIKFSETNKEVKYVTMYWTGKDYGSGVIGYKISNKQSDWGTGGYKSYNGNYSSYSDSYTFTENGTYYLYLKDGAGNEVCKGINIRNIDVTAPKIESFMISTNKYAQKVTVSWTAKDTGVGIRAWKISKDKDSWGGSYANKYKSLYSSISDSVTIKQNGTYYLFVQDDKGNTIRKEFTINNIDRDAPAFNAKPTVKNYGSYAVISYRAYDKKSGIKSWKLDGYTGTNYYHDKNGKETILSDTNIQNITVVKNGTYKLILKDAAGNAITSNEIKVSGIDATPPTIESSVKSDKKKAILTWSATDNVGITGYKIVKEANAGKSSGYTTIKSTKKLSNINNTFYENGIWYLYVKDAKGNYSFKKITVSDIDKTAPTIENIKFSSTNKEVKSVKMSWTGKDSGSGVIGYKISDKQSDYGKGGYTVYNKKYSSYIDSYTFTKNGKYYLYLKDDAGNETCKGINIKNIDTTEPGIEKFEISTNKYTQKVTVSWIATDTGVGVKAWKISKDKNSLNGKYTNIYEKRYSRKSDSATIKENGTYYLFIQDDNGNTKRKEFTINNIDRDDPEFTAKPTVKNYGSYAVISYRAQDKKSGIKSWKLEGYSGTNYYYNKDGKETIAADTNTQKITVVKNGTYKLILKDNVGNATMSEEIKVSGIDNVKPTIKSVKVIENTGKTVDKVNYIKKNSKVTFRVVFSEKVTIDKSKIKITGMNVLADTIVTKKINDTTFDIKITANTSVSNEVKVTLQNDFATDAVGNKLNEARTLDKIVFDDKAPVVKMQYVSRDTDVGDKVSAEITDNTKIAKMQWQIIDVDTNKVVWSGKMKENINKSAIEAKDNILTLNSYKGKIVSIYVEDILGNSRTEKINPPIKTSYNFVKREGDELTYRITMNLKAHINTSIAKADELKKYQTGNAKNYTFISLEADSKDNTGRKFLLKVKTDGTGKDAQIIIPKGTIYVYGKNNSDEKQINIFVDNTAPTINAASLPTNTMRTYSFSSNAVDKGSGLKKYNYEYIVNNKIKEHDTKDIAEKSKSSFDLSFEVKYNCKIKYTVWDNQGNSATKEFDVKNIDNVAPKISRVTYGDVDKNNNVEVTIVADEAIKLDNWENVDNKTIKRTYKETDLRGVETKAGTVIVKDLVGNQTEVKLEDKILPRVVGDIKMTNQSNGTKKVEIELSEEIQNKDELKKAGWILSQDKKHITKNAKFDEELYVRDLAGNDIEFPIQIDIEEEKVDPITYEIGLIGIEKDTVNYVEYELKRNIKEVDLLDLQTKYKGKYQLSEDKKKLKVEFYVADTSIHERIHIIEDDGRITAVQVSYLLTKGPNYSPISSTTGEYFESTESIDTENNVIIKLKSRLIKSFNGKFEYDHNLLELIGVESLNGWEVNINSGMIDGKSNNGGYAILDIANLKFKFKETEKLTTTSISINDIDIVNLYDEEKILGSVYSDIDNSESLNDNGFEVNEAVGFEAEKADYSLLDYGGDTTESYEQDTENQNVELQSADNLNNDSNQAFVNDGNDISKLDEENLDVNKSGTVASEKETQIEDGKYKENSEQYEENNEQDDESDEQYEEDDVKSQLASEENIKTKNDNIVKIIIIIISGILFAGGVVGTIIVMKKRKVNK